MLPALTRARWFARFALTAVIGLAMSAPAAGAASSLQLSEGGGATFPARALVLAVPGRSALTPFEVHVSENGKAVSSPVLTPIAKAHSNDFGVVLAIASS